MLLSSKVVREGTVLARQQCGAVTAPTFCQPGGREGAGHQDYNPDTPLNKRISLVADCLFDLSSSVLW